MVSSDADLVSDVLDRSVRALQLRDTSDVPPRRPTPQYHAQVKCVSTLPIFSSSAASAPTTARQAMQTRAIKADLANHRPRRQEGNSLPSALRPAADPSCLFMDGPNSIRCGKHHPPAAHSARY